MARLVYPSQKRPGEQGMPMSFFCRQYIVRLDPPVVILGDRSQGPYSWEQYRQEKHCQVNGEYYLREGISEIQKGRDGVNVVYPSEGKACNHHCSFPVVVIAGVMHFCRDHYSHRTAPEPGSDAVYSRTSRDFEERPHDRARVNGYKLHQAKVKQHGHRHGNYKSQNNKFGGKVEDYQLCIPDDETEDVGVPPRSCHCYWDA